MLIIERATEPDATTGKCSATLYALALSPLTGEAGGLGRFVPKSRQNSLSRGHSRRDGRYPLYGDRSGHALRARRFS